MTMPAVNLDYVGGRTSNWAGVLVLAIGLAGLGSTLWYYHDLRGNLSVKEMLASRLQEQEKSLFARPVAEARDAEQMALETKQANAAILELSLPWKGLFEALEATWSSEVAVLAIEPDAQNGVVRIRAEARRLDSMINYMSSLQRLAIFREVLIVSHQIQDQDPQKPVRFILQARWERQP
jgi:Tfp pilus assembly protein PilN